MSAESDATPVHDPAAHHWTVNVDGQRSLLDYALADGVLTIRHTEVPPALGGRGIAGRLVGAAFAWAREQGYKVRPACEYAAAWAKRHPDQADLLVA
jgi:predicted GNAT family acetyltransferase